MVLKSPSFFLMISSFMAASAILCVSAGRADAISPDLQIEGPGVEAPAPLPSGLGYLGKNDPTAIELGKFAIDEHNREAKDGLTFEGILEALYTNLGERKNYSLVIAATNKTGLDAYDAKVSVERGDKKLVAFTII